MKVLIALDGSATSDVVVQEVLARLWPEHSEFALVTAIDPFFFVRSPLLMAEAKQSAQDSLDESAQSLRAAGFQTTTEVVIDNPRQVLHKLADERRADLILVGSRGRSTIERLLLGSTAHAVLRHAHCSVEIVRARPESAMPDGQAMKILIPTDGSQLAEHALKSVAASPWPAGSQFKVIACPEFPILIGDFPSYSQEPIGEMIKISEDHCQEAVEKASAILKAAGIAFQFEITEPKDTPAHAILAAAAAWKPDLIILGSHGRRGMDRLFLGSISESVAMHAHCSVELVR